MILWTIQPLIVWEILQREKVFRCDPSLCSMPEPQFREKYQWLIDQMEKRIGTPPAEVIYPVWAWYMQNGRQSKPDLRSERWGNGPGDEQYTCIEVELPDDQVLLSDFDAWSIILLNGLLSRSEEEHDQLEDEYESLPPEKQRAFKEKNWERVFDLTPIENSWVTRGKWIQATFWELHTDNVRAVRFLKTGKKKEDEYYVDIMAGEPHEGSV